MKFCCNNPVAIVFLMSTGATGYAYFGHEIFGHFLYGILLLWCIGIKFCIGKFHLSPAIYIPDAIFKYVWPVGSLYFGAYLLNHYFAK